MLNSKPYRFGLLAAGVDKPTASMHNEPLPDDIELASNEFYMRHDLEITEHHTPPASIGARGSDYFETTSRTSATWHKT